MRTIYLQRALSLNGRGALGGRRLADRLRESSEAFLLGHLVMEEERAASAHPVIREDVISEIEMLKLDPDVIFLEGGLFSGGSGAWRIPEALASEFVEQGGTLIVADVNVNLLRDEQEEYQLAAGFLGAAASYRGRDPVDGYDERSFWKGTRQILCRPGDMVLSDWLRPVYDGIPEILCSLPVRLASWGDILASGNMHSTWSDASDGLPGPDNLPFASVRKAGQGFVVLICANVTGDVWIEGCPHNTAWLVNVARFLADAVKEDRRRTGSALKVQQPIFLSHAHADKEVVASVCQLLTREHSVGAWMDERQLIPGDSLPESIRDAVRGASTFVLFWSRAAAASEWVRRELDLALDGGNRRVLVVRLEDVPVPSRLSDLLRIEAAGALPEEMAHDVSRTLKRHQTQLRIEHVRSRAQSAPELARPQEPAQATRLPGSSLTRPEGDLAPTVPEPLLVAGSLSPPTRLATIQSDFRIDILCFIDGGTLVSGSGRFNNSDIESAHEAGLIDGFEEVSLQTGMDGHLDDHLPTRRHLVYGYHHVSIFDRALGDVVAQAECDSGANVLSAAWSPAGDRFIVGSQNYLTIADSHGRIISHENMWEPRKSSAPKSVAWQPSVNPVFAMDRRVCIANPDGRILCELTDLDATVIAVAVSPCRRFIAAAALNGQVAIWSETGRLLAQVSGIASGGEWSAARCLAFSPDSRLLAQSACLPGEGFLLLNLETGMTARIAAAGTHLLTFHPKRPGVLVTAAETQITFWQTPG
jgi:WD40 repeat protein